MNSICTKTWKALLCLFFSTAILFPHSGYAQHVFNIQGTILDSATSQPIVGATISLREITTGTESSRDGLFTLELEDNLLKEVHLVVRYTGYKKRELVVKEGNSIQVILMVNDTLQPLEVTISDERVPQKVLESPITISLLDAIKLTQLPQENMYAGLITVKGVDFTTNSLFYQNINMRGPANPLAESVLQLTDGMDNTPPGQGFTVGSLNGPNDLDIESIEIIPGSSSAIHGANAFSGLIDIHTKNPFEYRGFSMQVKNGVTYLDGNSHDPAWFSDYQLRYAKVWKEKFAVKVSAGFMQGTDWLNMDTTDRNWEKPIEERGSANPSRDQNNIYGDESHESVILGADSEEVQVSRTGYNANDVLGTHTDDLRLYASLHYKPKPNSEISYLFGYTLFNTAAHPSPWNLHEFRVMYHKLEWKSSRWFVRYYSVYDRDGHSYDGPSAATAMLTQWKSDSAWYGDYANAYNGLVPGITGGNHDLARNYANAGMPQPGSSEFENLLSASRDKPLNLDGGSRYKDESSLQHVHAQYDFTKDFSWMKIIAGAEGRLRRLYSEGTMFLDYPDQHINTRSLGIYVQCEKGFYNDKLKLLASARYDKYDAFAGTVTPRIAAVYSQRGKNFFRASFQSGTRTPDPFDMYQDGHNGQFYGIGGLQESDEKYLIRKRGFSFDSFYSYLTHVGEFLDQYGTDSLDAAVSLYKGLLQPAGLDYVHSERVQTAEVGYQCLLFNNNLHLDVDAFGSVYKDLIAYTWVVETDEGNPFSDDSLTAAAYAMLEGNGLARTTGYHTPVNYKDNVYSAGVEGSVEYWMPKGYVLSGNFIYQAISDIDPRLDTWLYLIPPLKTNVSISNPKVYHNLGFSVNWHWTDGWWSDVKVSPLVPLQKYYVHANSILDAQVTMALPKVNTFIKIGASNLLNHYYQNAPFGAAIGGAYYISIVYEGR